MNCTLMYQVDHDTLIDRIHQSKSFQTLHARNIIPPSFKLRRENMYEDHLTDFNE